jgi:asparagine synthase (glutamine-hydrolysing)
MLVSKLAREYVTVTLSGDGGDELFMGYGFYTWAKRLNHPALQLFRKPIYHLSKMAPAYFQQAGKMLNYPSVENSKSHIFSQEYFDENELKDLLIDNNSNFIPFNKNIKADRSLLVEEKQSFWDIENYLKDDLLVKVDRASMRFGLETRVPLLDNTIVEFALNLESDLKVKNGISKYLLKEVLYEYVPARFFERPKWGFGIPLEKWFNKELSFLYEKYFSSETIKKHGIINHNYFLDLKSKYEHTLSPQYKGKVWSILVLHWWLSENT